MDLSTARATDGGGPAAAPRPGEGPRGSTRIGLYEVMEELGRGGMGAVYRAWHPMRRKYVALKVIKPDIAGGDKHDRLKELFLREGGILMSIAHDNVVACYDANEALHEGKPVLYMALELLEGESLQQRLAKGPLPPREVAEVSRSLAKALRALHENEKRILHRDLKPANAFLTRAGGVKLLDFGLAGVADWRLTQVSMFAAGSRPYMSPEQFDGLRFCTERSDLYSLGCTIFQMVTGRCPFECDTDNAFLRAHKEKSAPTFAEVAPDLRESRDPLLAALQNVTTRLLAKRPDERYASAADLVRELDTVLGGGTVLPPKVTRPEDVRLRNRVLLALAGIVLSAAVGFGSVQYVRSGAAARVSEATARFEAGELKAANDILDEVLAKDSQNAPALALKDAILKESDRRTQATTRAQEEAARFDREKAALLEERALEAKAEEERKERERLDMAARRESASVALGRARAALEGADRAKARGHLESIPAADVAPEAATVRDEIARDLAAAEAVAAEWAQALEAERLEQHERTRELAARVAGTLEKGGPKLEARSGTKAALARALEARAGAGGAVKALEIAVQSKALPAIRAALPPAVLAGATRTAAPVVEAAHALLYGEAIKAAGVALAAAATSSTVAVDLTRAEAAAREALRALPLEEGAAFRALAARFEAERRATAASSAGTSAGTSTGAGVGATGTPETIARERLREALRAKPLARAEAAWLLLERAVARASIDTAREVLFDRLEHVTIGSDDAALKRLNPRRTIPLAPFAIDRDETTVADYARAVREGKAAAPVPIVWPDGAPPAGSDQRPVSGILHEDAVAYAASLTPPRRLPTADEWEAAAAYDPGGGERPRVFPWGDSWNPAVLLSDFARKEALPPEIGAIAVDATRWGGRGFASGVSEWTTVVDAGGRARPALSGGAYDESQESRFRVVRRERPAYTRASAALKSCGLRCARDVPAPALEELAR